MKLNFNHIFFFLLLLQLFLFFFFFFNDTATTEIYTLSLHDALPISAAGTARGWTAGPARSPPPRPGPWPRLRTAARCRDRKSTRLNSSHLVISYAVFCLKKKKKKNHKIVYNEHNN